VLKTYFQPSQWIYSRIIAANRIERLDPTLILRHLINTMNILSGCDHIRFDSHLNHAVYASMMRYQYFFIGSSRPGVRGYDHKLTLLSELPVDDQWWFWLDDDAFFTSFSSIDRLGLNFDDVLMIFPKSPVTPAGLWTYISSGNFFFRNSLLFKQFIADVLNTDMQIVKRWWQNDEHGFFTNGDQDKILFNLLEKGWNSHARFVAYNLFNTRPYHFLSDVKEHFLCHFAGGGAGTEGKLRQIEDFRFRLGLPDLTLIPHELEALKAEVLMSGNRGSSHEFRF
jgi:hypothetical protein